VVAIFDKIVEAATAFGYLGVFAVKYWKTPIRYPVT